MTHDMLTHRSPEEAARAWDAAAVLHFRHTVDVKMLNFPDEYPAKPPRVQLSPDLVA